MKRHRSGCSEWQTRENPELIRTARRNKTRLAARQAKDQVVGICDLCDRRADHHASGCLNSQAEVARRALVLKHGIDLREWSVVLKLLKRRYEDV